MWFSSSTCCDDLHTRHSLSYLSRWTLFSQRPVSTRRPWQPFVKKIGYSVPQSQGIGRPGQKGFWPLLAAKPFQHSARTSEGRPIVSLLHFKGQFVAGSRTSKQRMDARHAVTQSHLLYVKYFKDGLYGQLWQVNLLCINIMHIDSCLVS